VVAQHEVRLLCRFKKQNGIIALRSVKVWLREIRNALAAKSAASAINLYKIVLAIKSVRRGPHNNLFQPRQPAIAFIQVLWYIQINRVSKVL